MRKDRKRFSSLGLPSLRETSSPRSRMAQPAAARIHRRSAGHPHRVGLLAIAAAIRSSMALRRWGPECCGALATLDRPDVRGSRADDYLDSPNSPPVGMSARLFNNEILKTSLMKSELVLTKQEFGSLSYWKTVSDRKKSFVPLESPRRRAYVLCKVKNLQGVR